MPRTARAIIASYPHHVVQRGNNKQDVFFDGEDRAKYCALLEKYSEKWKAPILAYCLMTNHVHLLVKPKEDASLYKMMQGVSLCYTQFVNRKYGRTGRLWESRYHSCIVDRDVYLWAVARYIETNPVRARMVEKAEDYPYSSAPSHVAGVKDGLLGEELFDKAQRKDYRAFIRTAVSAGDMDRVRYHTRSGRPLGKDAFVSRLEKKTGRDFSRKPGRPRGKGGE